MPKSPRIKQETSSEPEQDAAPPSPPCSNTRKVDRSAQFRYEFQVLIHKHKQAKQQWIHHQKRFKGYCSNRRCIKLILAFCSNYGHEFEGLCKRSAFKKLGTRSSCTCSPSPSPLNINNHHFESSFTAMIPLSPQINLSPILLKDPPLHFHSYLSFSSSLVV